MATDPDLKTVYDQLCNSYRAIDDFRAKLLGFLPLVSGSGVFLLLSDSITKSPQSRVALPLLLPIGAFGFVVTLGLFCYEIYGIRKCVELIRAGKRLERLMCVEHGQFVTRPHGVLKLVSEPFSAAVIYPAVLAAWIFVAVYGDYPLDDPRSMVSASKVAARVFVGGFVISLIYQLFYTDPFEWRQPSVPRAGSDERFRCLETIMATESPYLKPKRLEDVIAALQFLGQYGDYKRSVKDWDEKLATPPRSVTDPPSWGAVFEDHPEFFRKNEDGLISLVWRRAMTKTSEGQRPALEPETVAKLVETAIRLHSSAVDGQRHAQTAEETKLMQVEQDRRWRIQLAVSVATGVLAFVGVVLAAWLKASGSG